MQILEDQRQSWLDQPIVKRFVLNWETALFALILILAVFSRLYILGARVMSHDENTHVYYSWRFYQGQGFAHDPLMHGPLQFHLLALSYFMFGDNDFTARFPAALFSIATVAFIWVYRRYLGRSGALVAAALMLISPYILYYGRYARNEAFVAFFGVATLWAILRFLDTGKTRYMYFLTAITILHYTSKETSFIYSAQALLFLGLYFLLRISRLRWRQPDMRNLFIVAVMAALLLLAAFAGFQALGDRLTPTSVQVDAGQELAPLQPSGLPVVQAFVLGLLAVVVLAGLYFLIRGFTWQGLCAERSFSLLIVQFTLVIPQLAALPITWIGKLINDTGWKVPTNVGEVMALTTTDIFRMAMVLIPLLIISAIIGLLWNRREWLINAGIWYAIFTVFYSSMFTNGAGIFTGLVGSLGYWLEQQPVQRGGQPMYYYALVQVPVYEYLPLLGTLLAFGIAIASAIKKGIKTVRQPELSVESAAPVAVAVADGLAEETPGEALSESPAPDLTLESAAPFVASLDERQEDTPGEALGILPGAPAGAVLLPLEEAAGEPENGPAFALLAFWSVTSMIAYSIAGEKMPWLTVHITLPMILCAGWALGKLVDAVDWAVFTARRGWLVLALIPVALLSLVASIGSILGPQPPFQGSTLDQLQATSTFLISFLAFVASAAGLFFLARSWASGQLLRVVSLAFFALLGALTTRTAIQSSYYNYDNANELLVYAHSAGGVKVAMAQIEEISKRTTDGYGLSIAYDSETSYPYWWYLRDYTNVRYYGADPTRSLRDAAVILVGDANFGKIEPVVGNSYYRFDYMRLWWPNQDYYGLTWERFWKAFTDREMRAALFDIWLNRDYTRFGKITGFDSNLANWSPAARMRLYVRKDIVTQLWNYGVAPSADLVEPKDPFDTDKMLNLSADIVLGQAGNLPGQFQRPRDLAVAPDGTLYVADTDNNRIQHLSRDGEALHVWGSYGDAISGDGPGGTFNQPWGIAVGPDGSVYVADTWNHRIQKFAPDGQFLMMWGYFGQAEEPTAFWGPRDVAVDPDGRVFVTDTGNKRVVVFDADGNPLAEFGSAGLAPGQFDEPVGIAVDGRGQVFVADTWNQRIQVFIESEPGTFTPERSWDMVAWFGQSLDNKPYLAVDDKGNLFVVEPEGYRVLWFGESGMPLHYWGDFGDTVDRFGMPASVAIDPLGGIWVSDAGNNRIMHFILPAQ